MTHRTKVLFGTLLLGVAATTMMVLLQRVDPSLPMLVSTREQNDFDAILNALVVPPPVGPMDDSDREALSKRLMNRQEAVEKLRQAGTNILPRLMEEVRAVRELEMTDPEAAMDASKRLSAAFEVLGGDAEPLLPLLITEFRAGRSIGPSAAGLVYIGGTDAGLVLVSGITNSNPDIRNAAMLAVTSFATNREVAFAAAPFLLLRLQDDSELSRALASSALGSLRVDAKTVLPALLQAAERDSDIVVRSIAIKAIGRFGTNAASVKPNLEAIVATSQDEIVRRTASIAIQSIEGKLPPDDIY